MHLSNILKLFIYMSSMCYVQDTDILGHFSVSSCGRCMTFTGKMTTVYSLNDLPRVDEQSLGSNGLGVWSQ